MTSGNHIWDKKEAIDYIGAEPRLLRPANYPAGVPGQRQLSRPHRATADRSASSTSWAACSCCNIDDPFASSCARSRRCDRAREVIFVDFHAEATSEKIAMGWHLDGKVTAVVGTHTHVQTADERMLPKGTAYLTDVGMTGPHDSIIGVEIEPALGRFLTGDAGALRDRHRESPPERGRRRRGRTDRAWRSTSSASATASTSLQAAERMPDLFDLPFEEDDRSTVDRRQSTVADDSAPVARAAGAS